MFLHISLLAAIAVFSSPAQALALGEHLPGRVTVLVRGSQPQGYEFAQGVIRKTEDEELPNLLVTKPQANSNFKIHPGRDLAGVAQSPDGRYVACLTSKEAWGFLPWELLAAVAGHPIPKVTFWVEVFDSNGERIVETTVVKGVAYGEGAIAWLE